MHVFATDANARPDDRDYRVTLRQDKFNPERTTTRVDWVDGRNVTADAGRLPEWAPKGGLQITFPGRTTNQEENRRVEEEHGIPRGILDR